MTSDECYARNVLFAATFPERLRSLFWWYPSPRSTHADDYPWGGNEHDLEKWMQDIVENWGTASYNDPDDPSGKRSQWFRYGIVALGG